MAEKKVIERSNWIANFNLIGEAKINDYTFKIDEKSEKSAWRYSSLNLGVDCGEKHGTVYCEMIGGFSEEQASVIYAHGKNDDGTDDYSTQIQVAWEDRFNPEILETIGDASFITIGLEQTDKGKTFYKKFLSAYDAIAYVKNCLEDGTVINVHGNLRYSLYQDRVMIKKNITSIALSRADDASKYAARFTQSILLNKDSASFSNLDKNKDVMYIDAIVLDYVKELNGIEIKGQYPFKKQFEYEFPNLGDEQQCKTIMDKLFKVKKDVTQITFEGDFVEGGAVITATLDDIPQDIKDLIDCGVYTEEEALARCSSNGNREQHMILRKPLIRLVGEEKQPVTQKFEGKYKEDDLILDYLNVGTNQDASGAMNPPEESAKSSDTSDDMSWLESI